MPSYKGISIILHKKQNSSLLSSFTSYKSHQEYTGPHYTTPRVNYVRWQEVCETSIEATELFARFPHDVILKILRELDFTDIVSFSKVNNNDNDNDNNNMLFFSISSYLFYPFSFVVIFDYV